MVVDVPLQVALIAVLHNDVKVALTGNLNFHTVNQIGVMGKFF